MSLNELRFEHYQLAANKSTFKLEKLPPTEGAAAQHSYRVYHQIQTWLGYFENELWLGSNTLVDSYPNLYQTI